MSAKTYKKYYVCLSENNFCIHVTRITILSCLICQVLMHHFFQSWPSHCFIGQLQLKYKNEICYTGRTQSYHLLYQFRILEVWKKDGEYLAIDIFAKSVISGSCTWTRFKTYTIISYTRRNFPLQISTKNLFLKHCL